jgi:hypothetical protein
MLKVTLLPSTGVPVFTDLNTARSAAALAVTVAEAELLAVFGSGTALLICAVLVMLPAWTASATMVNVAVAPFTSVPIDHWPVVESYEPRLGVADRKLKPMGS